MSIELKKRAKPKRKEPNAAAFVSAATDDDDDEQEYENSAKKPQKGPPFRRLTPEEALAGLKGDDSKTLIGSRIEILSDSGLQDLRKNSSRKVKNPKAFVAESLLTKVTVVRIGSVQTLALRDRFPSSDIFCDLFKSCRINITDLAVCEEQVEGGGGTTKKKCFVWVLRAFLQNSPGGLARWDFRIPDPQRSLKGDLHMDYEELVDYFDTANPLTHVCAWSFFFSPPGGEFCDYYRNAVEHGNRMSIACKGTTKHKDVPFVPPCFYDRVKELSLPLKGRLVKRMWGVELLTTVQIASLIGEPNPVRFKAINLAPGRTDPLAHYWSEDPELDQDASNESLKTLMDDLASDAFVPTRPKKMVLWKDPLSEAIDNKVIGHPDQESEMKKQSALDADLVSAMHGYRSVLRSQTARSPKTRAFDMNHVEVALAALVKFSISDLENNPVEMSTLSHLTELGVMLKYRAAQRSKSMHPLQLPSEDIEAVLAMANQGRRWTDQICIPRWSDVAGPLLLFMPTLLREDADSKSNTTLAPLCEALKLKMDTLLRQQTPDAHQKTLVKSGLYRAIKDVPVKLPTNAALAVSGPRLSLAEHNAAARAEEETEKLLELGAEAARRKEAEAEAAARESATRLRLSNEAQKQQEQEQIDLFVSLSKGGGASGKYSFDGDEIDRLLADTDEPMIKPTDSSSDESATKDADGDVKMS